MKKFSFLTFFVLLFFIFKVETSFAKQTICLNMIVKNESKVIKRCLESVKPLIDYWVIVDTGSTDGTQGIIKEFMKEIPGILEEDEWVNFEYNRNRALKFAKDKADYLLFMDAHDELGYSKDFVKPYLDKDFYYFEMKYGGSKFYRVNVIKSALDWEWQGVLHEYVHSPMAQTSDIFEGIINLVKIEGCRSQDPQKYQKDTEILEKALLAEPNNERYVFYLAQSYRDSLENELAIKNYEKRVSMRGWDQEVFISLYQIAKLQEILEMDPKIFIESYYKAYCFRPTRIEPLYHLANYYRRNEEYYLGYTICKLALHQQKSDDMLFVNEWMYEYGILLELSICAYWVEKYSECMSISEKLLNTEDLPENVYSCLENNLKWAKSKLSEVPFEDNGNSKSKLKKGYNIENKEKDCSRYKRKKKIIFFSNYS